MRLTNDHKVDILGEELAPLHPSHVCIACVLLTRCVVKEVVKEVVGQYVGII